MNFYDRDAVDDLMIAASIEPIETALIPRESVAAEDLTAPPICERPLPGDRIEWYDGPRQMSGTVVGHRGGGELVVKLPIGHEQAVSEKRPLLATNGPPRRAYQALSPKQILRPRPEELQRFVRLAKCWLPERLAVEDVTRACRGRGHEVYLVGGIVRDTIHGGDFHDVDLIGSMPVRDVFEMLRSMTKKRRSEGGPSLTFGHLGLSANSEPGVLSLDYCTFRHAYPGTSAAIFDADFTRDVGHRDFSMNAIYYDLNNQVLIDPTGHGIADAVAFHLRPAWSDEFIGKEAQGAIAVRYFKFRARGATADATCGSRIVDQLDRLLGDWHPSELARYIRRQVVRKNLNQEEEAMEKFHAAFVSDGAREAWRRYVDPLRDLILAPSQHARKGARK